MRTRFDYFSNTAALLLILFSLPGCYGEATKVTVPELTKDPLSYVDQKVRLQGCLYANRHRPAIYDCSNLNNVIILEPTEKFSNSREWLSIRSANLLPPSVSYKKIIVQGSASISGSKVILTVDDLDYLDD